jgi:mono/diheme cytochrome c family protein
MRIPLALALLLGAVAHPAAAEQPAAASQPSPSRGQLLYETHCIQCHTDQIHWREARSARDWQTLREQVVRWQQQTGHRWSDEDIDAVAYYLNRTIYHFQPPKQRG